MGGRDLIGSGSGKWEDTGATEMIENRLMIHRLENGLGL